MQGSFIPRSSQPIAPGCAMAAQNIISATILEACRIRNLSASASNPLCACRSLARLSSGSLTSLSSCPCKLQRLLT